MMMRIRMNTAEILLTIVTVCTIQGTRAGLAGFGGDYGEYLELLKGNDVLDDLGGGGLDDIEEGQDRQEAVMGGEEEELKEGFLRHLTFKKEKKKTNVHFHFDVNVLVVNKNMTESSKLSIEKVGPNLEKEIKFMERNSNGGSSPSSSKTEPFDWKAMQVRSFKVYDSSIVFSDWRVQTLGEQTHRTIWGRSFWWVGRKNWRRPSWRSSFT